MKAKRTMRIILSQPELGRCRVEVSEPDRRDEPMMDYTVIRQAAARPGVRCFRVWKSDAKATEYTCTLGTVNGEPPMTCTCDWAKSGGLRIKACRHVALAARLVERRLV